MLMYKTINKSTPNYLTKIFENINFVHSHNVRNSEYNVYVPRPSTEAGKNSFRYQGAVLWKSLSRDAKSQSNLRSFKNFLCR